ncbi:signal peptidase I [Faecalibaculum rodentium]|uniref:signal peptidase I n=1 Tax=Faecalibaculum rodentium TaxID=1702221 RepID=UPI0025B781AF|nr:signal peptidase I [Faecalibaculum rodentium]
MKKILAGFLVFLALLCMVLGAAIVTFKITGLRFCTVDGHSMDNTLFDGEQLLLNPSAEIRSGDIVVFEYGQTYLIKRVVGLPGDTVAVVKGVLYVNNIKYDESYLSEECITRFMDSSFMVTVGEDEYFVMGDNRDNSRDSRSFGCVPRDTITGVAIWHF